jgi:poly-gamma-glutamate capsule biosynthesis protein CapA/YwtB (metallophosphatase superfamily)
MRTKSFIILILFFFSCNDAGGLGKDVTLVAVGDIMLGRYIAHVMKTRGNDFPFRGISATLRGADVVFGNLEAIISPDTVVPAYPGKPYNFHATNSAAPALRRAGFSILTVANNHAMDYGPGSLMKTKEILRENGIPTFGAGRDLNEARLPAVIVVGNIRFGFLGYGIAHSRSVYAKKNRPGIAPIRLDDIRKDIVALRSKVDVLIVSLHWGTEYENKPSEQQRVAAHKIIDWGADMIIGHHPHVIQGIERYKGKIIAYSLGNFIFDQKGISTTRSFMLICKVREHALYSTEIIPLGRFRRYFPKIAEGEEKNRLLSYISALSRPLNGPGYVLSKVGTVQ